MGYFIRYFSDGVYSYQSFLKADKEEQKIYFPKTNQFNTSKDCNFTISTGGNAERCLKKHEFEKIEKILKEKGISIEKDLENYIGLYLEKLINQEIGIACFSKAEEIESEKKIIEAINPKMLTDYSNGQQGFCCVYKFNDKVSTEKGSVLTPHEVSYEKENRHFSIRTIVEEMIDSCNEGNSIPDCINKLNSNDNPLLNKHISYKQENEYRYFHLPEKLLPLKYLGLELKRIYLGPVFLKDFYKKKFDKKIIKKKLFLEFLLRKYQNITYLLCDPVSHKDMDPFIEKKISGSFEEIIDEYKESICSRYSK